jgi:hypothetical protein
VQISIETSAITLSNGGNSALRDALAGHSASTRTRHAHPRRATHAHARPGRGAHFPHTRSASACAPARPRVMQCDLSARSRGAPRASRCHHLTRSMSTSSSRVRGVAAADDQYSPPTAAHPPPPRARRRLACGRLRAAAPAADCRQRLSALTLPLAPPRHTPLAPAPAPPARR